MPAFRYAAQEAANIRKAQTEATRQSALNASLASRKVQQASSNGNLNTWASVPATATSTGTAGQIAHDSSFIYICTATNTWRRAALSTW